MYKGRDITGKKFHKLTALEHIGYERGKGSKWRCLCDCGKETIAFRNDLRKGDRRSCGCNKNNIKDITGQRFGDLIAVEPTQERVRGNVVWKCVCSCGGEKLVTATDLRNGTVKSCGCLHGGSRKRYLNEYEEIFSCRIPDGYRVILLDGDQNNLTSENMVLVKNSVAKTLKKKNLLSSDRELSLAAIRLTELRAKIYEVENNKRRIL